MDMIHSAAISGRRRSEERRKRVQRNEEDASGASEAKEKERSWVLSERRAIRPDAKLMRGAAAAGSCRDVTLAKALGLTDPKSNKEQVHVGRRCMRVWSRAVIERWSVGPRTS